MKTATALNKLHAGDRVELIEVVDNYPHIWADVGLTGTVAEVGEYSGNDIVWVTLDKHFPSIAEWDNQLEVWGEVHPNALSRIEGIVRFPCKFRFEASPAFSGFHNTTGWNGFDNIWVTEDTRAAIAAWLRTEGETEAADDVLSIPAEAGLVSLANGYATQIVEPCAGCGELLETSQDTFCDKCDEVKS